MNLVLCGLPKSGKTTIGQALSKALQWHFIDTDRLIETAYAHQKSSQLSCREIFLLKGEAFFRTLEKQQISSLKDVENSVIATGGGALNDPNNFAIIGSLGPVIYLEISIERLLKRFVQQGIPPYLNVNEVEPSLRKLAEKRIPIYEKLADYSIRTDKLCANEIVSLIKERYDL